MNQYGANQPLNSAPPQYASDQYGSSQPYSPSEQQPKTVYQDKLWAVLFILHLIVVIGIGSVCVHRYQGQLSNSATVRIDRSTVLLGLAVCGIGGAIALAYLLLIKTYASALIKLTLALSVLASIAVLVVSVMAGSIMGIIMASLGLVAQVVYTYLVRSRIAFASALLTMATKPVRTFNGTIAVAFLGVLAQAAWTALWAIVTFAIYVALSQHTVQPGSDVNAYNQGGYTAYPARAYAPDANAAWSRTVDAPVSQTVPQQAAYYQQMQQPNWQTVHRRSLLTVHQLIQQADGGSKAQTQANLNANAIDANSDNANADVASTNSVGSSDSIDSAAQSDPYAQSNGYASTTRRRQSYNGNSRPRHDSMSPGTICAMIALLVSFYWTFQVIKNIVHCTISGVAASWVSCKPCAVPFDQSAAALL